jgi:pimeloyl-ACP methyl ester carboxylesterase
MDGFLQYNSGKIHYKDQGKGAVIVLVHGYLETAEIWNGFTKRLSDKLRVIAVDLPGHGKSDIFSEVHTMDFMACILARLLENLNIEKVFLVGHSLGGYVTLAFADLFPGMLSGYCLFHSHPFADTQETIKNRKKEINLVKEGKKDLFYPANITRLYATSNLQDFSEAIMNSKEIASTIPGEAIIAVLEGMIARPARVEAMEAGKVPCLWILGALDNHINCEAIQSRVHLPENTRVIVLKKSGHMGFIEEEDNSAKIILEFVKKITS